MLLMLVPLSWASRAIRRWLFAEWNGPLGWLGGTLTTLGLWLLLAQVLGSIGAFSRWPMVLACVSTGCFLAVWAGRRGHYATSRQGPRPVRGSGKKPSVRAMGALAAGAVAGVATVWIARSAWSFFGGISSSWDSVWYHLPFASRFVQSGSLVQLQDIASPPSTFLPANGEVFHALGLLALQNDVLSPLWNLLWLALMLLAAWCVGIPSGRSHLTLLIGGLVAAWPILQSTQPGTANTDIVGIAFIVAAVGLLLNAEGRLAPVVLAGAALGLAAGVKLSLLPVAVGLLPMVVVAVRRFHKALIVLGVTVVTGCFWYVRNFVRVGNPFPWISVRMGPFYLPRVASEPVDCGTAAVARYISRADVWTQWFIPGLRAEFGSLWWIALSGGILGAVFGLVRGRNTSVRLLGGAALAGVVLYSVTPATAGGSPGTLPGTLHCFAFNLRFLVPALTLGLLAGSLTVSRRAAWPAALAVAALFAVTLPASRRAGLGGVVAAATITVTVFLLGTRTQAQIFRPRPRQLAPLAAAAILLIAVAGHPLTNRYLELRYANRQFEEAVGQAARWARDVSGARIGVAGFAMTYPLFGLHGMDNQVEYVSRQGLGWPFPRARSCNEWRSALHASGYTHVVVGAWVEGEPPPREAQWTLGDAGAREILRDGPTSVFALNPYLPPSPCPKRKGAQPSPQPGPAPSGRETETLPS
jgi:hypothetical protein